MRYPKKTLGQNFLKDLNIVKKIINCAEISGKNILEIGPGKGILTNEILKKNPKSLILIEKDDFLASELALQFSQNKIVKIYNEDVLKFDFENKLKKDTIIFGNLPYNISSQILVKLVKLSKKPLKYLGLVFMFQKEMADRIIGKFGTSKYGRLSILTNYKLEISNKFEVSPNCFFPIPKVNSTVLFLKPKKEIFNKIKNIENLEKITNILFSNKRKMINKNIYKIFKENKKIKLIKDLNLNSRPSNLKPETYYEITELFEKI